MNFVEINDGKCDLKDNNFVIPNRGYEWDDFQKFAFHGINNNKNILVCAPTASGKTTVAEYAIIKHILDGNKVIFTTPIKSLSNEKFNEFKQLLKPYNIIPGILTGDNKENVDSQVLIATAEILNNSLYKLKNGSINKDNIITSDFIDEIKCVIMDEVHYINDDDRGHVWEETITLLDRDIQLVMLSATINKPEKFAEWIGKIKEKNIVVVKKDKRPVPLTYYIYDGLNSSIICNSNNEFNSNNYMNSKKNYDSYLKSIKKNYKNNMINSIVEYCKNNNLFQTIMFVFSKQKCESIAQSITNSLLTSKESSLASNEFTKRISSFKDIYEKLPIYSTLHKLICKGICFHHSGLLPIFKEIIEIMFKNGFIKLLIATETFSVGINMPVRSIILTNIKKYSNNKHRLLRPDEFKQICGRAGRRGQDKFGHAILCPLYEFYTEKDLRNMIFGKMPTIESKMYIDYNIYLKLQQSLSGTMDSIINNTLLNAQNIIKSKSLNEENKKIKEKIKELELILSKDIELVNYFEKYINLTSNNNSQITLKLTKKQQKELASLKDIIQKNKVNFDIYNQILNLKNDYSYNIDYFNYLNGDENVKRCLQLENFLKKFNYIDNNSELTIKGVSASQINECECSPLLIEIFNLILDNDEITYSEIVSILSILLDKSKLEREYDVVLQDVKNKPEEIIFNNIENNENIIYCTVGVKNMIDKIKNVCNNCMEEESKLEIYHYSNYWELTLGYVDISYKWSSGKSILELIPLIDNIGDDLGIFSKNMLKLYNILSDLKNIATSINKFEIIQKLDEACNSILRDIVNTFSLHLID